VKSDKRDMLYLYVLPCRSFPNARHFASWLLSCRYMCNVKWWRCCIVPRSSMLMSCLMTG
jgi:hypothetical protein